MTNIADRLDAVAGDDPPATQRAQQLWETCREGAAAIRQLWKDNERLHGAVRVWIDDRDRLKSDLDRVTKREDEVRRDLWGRIYALHDEYGLDRPQHDRGGEKQPAPTPD